MKPTSYKLLILLLVASILGILTVIPSIMLLGTENAPKQVKSIQGVDLPEEYKSLSHNSAKPDTVLAFYDNDTVYIEFNHGKK